MKDDVVSRIVGTILLILIVVGGYYVSRLWNSFWYYDSATENIVCEMVKPEYLKNPDDCK
jgi:hypothetical protein